MKLNHDCVRKLMLVLEDNLEIGDIIDASTISIDDFSESEILYSALKLHEANFISGKVINDLSDNNNILINGITWEGHKFLDTIRDNKVWSHTKTVLSKVSSSSITFASTVASQVLTNIISQSLGIQTTI